MRSAIILAGGGSTRMSGDKGLRKLGGEAMVLHVIRRVSDLVDEVLLVVSSEGQWRSYSEVVGDGVEVLVDMFDGDSPLVGAVTGFKHARGEYALITGCDTPFVSPEAVQLLFREGEGFDGAVFQWPNGWIEPLVAVYRVEPSLRLGLALKEMGDLRLRMILRKLRNVRMIPVGALREIDPGLLTLFDADTEDALLEAEKMLNNIELMKKRETANDMCSLY